MFYETNSVFSNQWMLVLPSLQAFQLICSAQPIDTQTGVVWLTPKLLHVINTQTVARD